MITVRTENVRRKENGSPDKDRRAFHEFIPQVLPELFGAFLLAADNFHEEVRVVCPRISVCIMSVSMH